VGDNRQRRACILERRLFVRLAALFLFVLLAVVPAVVGEEKVTTAYLSPEVLNSHVIFSKGCPRIIFSSNRYGPVRPFVVDMTNLARPQVSALSIDEPGDFIAQSLAPDCQTLALVTDHNGSGLFDVYLYDLRRQTLHNIRSAPSLDEGHPVFFGPGGRFLAYLAKGNLFLYDRMRSSHLAPPPRPTRFQSITPSENGDGLYLEDEATNIWRYEMQPPWFRRIWNAPRLSYSPRMLFERRGHLLFVSDHESDFAQIYDLNLRDKSVKRLYASQHDQYSPRTVSDRRYIFRTNIDGNFVAGELKDGTYASLSPASGVVYDFSLDFGTPLLLYSDDQLPTSLVRMTSEGPAPLLPSTFEVSQPTAIPVRNADGMTNFLYLPAKAPKGWLIWLHGGPHEQVSPRFNLYFDFFVKKGLAVYAINYPGSTGMGNSYELRGVGEAQSIQIQLSAIDRDISQLRQLHHEISSLTLVGVSYSTILGHLLLPRHPEIIRFVDFSGVAAVGMVPPLAAGTRPYPPILFVYGENDFALRQPGRLKLMSEYESRSVARRLILANEGHFIQRRGDIDTILREMDRFLGPSPHLHN
jgi:hypothetical protein